MKKITKKIGLALGGGGARGCAHIGVIRALWEANIPIHYIAGTSIGSMMGAALALGKMEEVEEVLTDVSWQDVVKHFDPTVPKRGLFKGEKVVKLIERIIGNNSFKKTKIPFIAVATDLMSGHEVHLNEGRLVDAIRASIAIPGIITPFKKKNRYLVDGGVTNPLPTNVVREMGAEIVISVDLNHSFLEDKGYKSKQPNKSKPIAWLTPSRPNIIDVIEGSIFGMQNQLTQQSIKVHKPDFLIQPELGHTGIFDFHKSNELMFIGYEETIKVIDKIKRKTKR